MTDPDQFTQIMTREWDMSLWFGRGVDSPARHPEDIEYTYVLLSDMRALKRATYKD